MAAAIFFCVQNQRNAQQMKLVDIVPRRLAFAAVYGNSVPNLILDNEHTEFS